MIKVIDLSAAGKGNYVRSRSIFILIIWFFVEACFIDNKLLPFSGLRVFLLRLFGARIGPGCRFPHPLKVKFPWNLEVGGSCWFGEDVWIWNQAQLTIGSNVCVSQGTFISTGSHDIFDTMDLRVAPVIIEDGVWISSRCILQMGIVIGRSAVVTPGSVVHKSLDAGGIFGGNPCAFIRARFPEKL